MRGKSLIIIVTILFLSLLLCGCTQSGSYGASSNPAEGMQVATISSVHGSDEPTPISPVEPSDPEILIYDDFSDPNSGWEVFEDEYGKTAYQQGGFLIEAIMEDFYNWVVAGVDYSDIQIDVDIETLHTVSNKNDSYGVDCRIQENGDGYGFRITSDGFVGIELFANDETTMILDWETNDAVKTDGSINHLTARCQGNQLTLIVNNQLIGTVTDNSFSSGDIALSALSFEADPVDVIYDNLVVRQLFDNNSTGTVNEYSLMITNPTSSDVCRVYIVPAESEYWRNNHLSDDEKIAPGESRMFTQSLSNLVDVRIETCEYLTLLESYEIDLEEISEIILTDPLLIKEFEFSNYGDFPQSVTNANISIRNSDYYSMSVNGEDILANTNSSFSGIDVRLHSDASLVKTGQDALGLYGLTCRMQDDKNGIFFAIRGDGEASIQKIVDGKLENLTGWRSTEMINPGINSNYIEAYCIGSEYDLYINGDFITTVTDYTFTSGLVGLAVFSPAGAVTQADFDFLNIYLGE